MNFKKYFIVKRENMKESNIANKFICVKLESWDCKILKIPKHETAPSIGIEIKNEIFAASVLLKLRNLAAVIAIPDLLTPGNNDRTWNTPIKIANLREKFFLILYFNLNLSLI